MSETFPQQIRRHYWHNFAIIAGVEGCWGLGAAAANTTTILPVFLDRLGASKFVIGLVPAVFMLCLNGPQLLAARFTRHLRVKKVVFTLIHYPGTLPLIALGVLTLTAGQGSRDRLIGFTFVWIALFGLAISFAMPMWINLMAKLFPASVRGRSFGAVMLLGSVLGAAGSTAVAYVLRVEDFPRNFGILFIAAGIVLSACVTTFFWLREPPSLVAEDEAREPFLKNVLAVLRERRDFMWFLLARCTAAFGIMADGFCAVAGVQRFALGDEASGEFSVALLSAQVVGSLVGGWLGDRMGFRLLMLISIACSIGSSTVALAAPTHEWYYLVFVLLGLRRSVGMIAVHNMTIEFCPTEDKTTFVAIASTILCPAIVASYFIGSLIAQHHHASYNAVFVVSMLCASAAFLITLFCVREPRRAAPAPAAIA